MELFIMILGALISMTNSLGILFIFVDLKRACLDIHVNINIIKK
jgi:hypothetical protein